MCQAIPTRTPQGDRKRMLAPTQWVRSPRSKTFLRLSTSHASGRFRAPQPTWAGRAPRSASPASWMASSPSHSLASESSCAAGRDVREVAQARPRPRGCPGPARGAWRGCAAAARSRPRTGPLAARASTAASRRSSSPYPASPRRSKRWNVSSPRARASSVRPSTSRIHTRSARHPRSTRAAAVPTRRRCGTRRPPSPDCRAGARTPRARCAPIPRSRAFFPATTVRASCSASSSFSRGAVRTSRRARCVRTKESDIALSGRSATARLSRSTASARAWSPRSMSVLPSSSR